jgi:hypothetical protein
MRYNEDVIEVKQKIEISPTEQVSLTFGEAAKFVTEARNFIYQNGDYDAVEDYKARVQEWRNDHLPAKEMLEMEMVVLRDVFKSPHESLTNQFGFDKLVKEFRANKLGRVADGFDDVQIQEPSQKTTMLSIFKNGWGETVPNLVASLKYRYLGG